MWRGTRIPNLSEECGRHGKLTWRHCRAAALPAAGWLVSGAQRMQLRVLTLEYLHWQWMKHLLTVLSSKLMRKIIYIWQDPKVPWPDTRLGISFFSVCLWWMGIPLPLTLFPYVLCLSGDECRAAFEQCWSWADSVYIWSHCTQRGGCWIGT